MDPSAQDTEMFVPRKVNKEEDLNPDGDILGVMRVKEKMNSAIKLNSMEVNHKKWLEILLGTNISDNKLDKLPSTIVTPAFTFCEEKIRQKRMKRLPGSATTVISGSQMNDNSDYLSMHGYDMN
ncbi:unnamed protein product [Moneuplotes crassus]|uniref:Uncharacterized protein n=1 Tax=Euplotes crassus TaxID=5936 RepID=A0AAD1Y6V7_EUPCR|nr:unnamed protein product [Moneuplotes crassus]